VIQSSADRLTKLSAKWEELRGPLLQQYRDLKAESETRETETTRLLDEMRAMRERMKEVADETRLKDDLYKQLVRERRMCVWRGEGRMIPPTLTFIYTHTRWVNMST